MKSVGKGLFLNAKKLNQPDTYPVDALNANFDKIIGSVSNEEGFSLFITKIITGTTETSTTALPTDLICIGNVNVDETRNVLFLAKTKSTEGDYQTGALDSIGVLHNNGVYEHRLRADMGFSQFHQIQAKAKIKNGEIIVSWTDDLNHMRILNLDNLPFKGGVDPATLIPNTLSELTLIDVYPEYDVPTITVDEVNDSGGQLSSGAYQFFTAYEDGNTSLTNYSSPTKPLTITEDKSSVQWYEYDGCEAGTTTTKSVAITISDIDERYSFLNVGYISRINSVKSVYLFYRVAITSSSTELVFSGFETDTAVPLTSYLAQTAPYKKAKTIFTLNDKLGFGNLEGFEDIDYQKYANSITVAPVFTTTQHEEYSLTNFKDSVFIINNKGLMPGEVYAVYVGFTLKNGNRTYAYPVPGREVQNITVGGNTFSEDATMRDIISLDPALNYLEADDLIDPGNIKYFHTRDTSNNKTQMCFWENANEKYPELANDPDGNWEVWGFTGVGNETGSVAPSLHGLNVRHHKMPCQTGGWYNETTKTSSVCSIKLENIVIPEEIEIQVEKMHVYIAKRSTNNSTILGQSLYYSDSDNQFAFHSFDMMTNSLPPMASYIENVCLYKFKGRDSSVGGSVFNCYYSMYDITAPVPDVYTTSDNTRIGALKNFIHEDDLLLGEDMHERRYYGEVSVPTVGYPGISKQGRGESYLEPYYYLTNACVYRQDMYSPFQSQELYDTGNDIDIDVLGTYTKTITGGGDVFNTDYAFRTIEDSGSFTPATQGNPTHSERYLYWFPCIATSNIGLRYSDSLSTSSDAAYWPKYGPYASDWAAYLSDDIDTQANIFDYNIDYSAVNDMARAIPTPLVSATTIHFPNRLMVSEASSQEELAENWKNFLVNNYHDMPSTRGEVWNVVNINDELLVNTSRAIFKTIGSKKLQLDEITTYIGSGDLFSLEPQEQAITEDGFAGCTSQWSCKKLPIGYVYVNQELGKIFLYDGKLNDISGNAGIWFKEELPSKLKAQVSISISNPEITFDNNVGGVGIHIEYDQKYNRIIMSKRDVEIKDILKFKGYGTGVLVDGDLGLIEFSSPLDGYYMAHYDASLATWNAIDYSNIYDLDTNPSGLFTDKSWTMTFSLNTKEWRSYHSYIPSMMLRNDKNLMSAIKPTYSLGAKMYKHNTANKYGRYYDQNNPDEFYVEYVINTSVDYTTGQVTSLDTNKLFDAFQWITEVFDSNGTNYYGKTFTKLLIYSENQCSGVIDLSSANVKSTEGTWRFNDFKDIVITYANQIINQDKGIPTGTNASVLTDNTKVITSNINASKRWYEKSFFRGKYIVIRFVYSNSITEQYEIYMHKYDAMLQKSYK